MVVGTVSRRTNALTRLGRLGTIRITRGTLPGAVRLNSLVKMQSLSDVGVALTRNPSVLGGTLISTTLLEPWLSPSWSSSGVEFGHTLSAGTLAESYGAGSSTFAPLVFVTTVH